MATSPPQTRARIGFDHDEDPPSPRHAPRPPRRRRPVSRRVRVRRRRIAAAVAVVLAVLIVWLGISLGGALTNPALGSSVSARFAEWARDHGFATVVNWAENQWYAHHQPPKGGRPPKGAIPTGPAATLPTPVGPPHLAVPAAVVSPASPPLAGEGQWHAAGRLVGGIPAVYEAFVRPDTIHTSEVVGIAWMDTKL
ncbi:MAG TPA: hypothetical protein VKG43_08845, partial [Acidimicrobiales bacterium]|nr:hypothetical protein [Acidimicrobiales bacterium]